MAATAQFSRRELGPVCPLPAQVRCSRRGTEKTTQPWASAESNFRFRCYRTLEKERPTVRWTGATTGLISAAADRCRGLWQASEVDFGK
jgi:hypothetical protein